MISFVISLPLCSPFLHSYHGKALVSDCRSRQISWGASQGTHQSSAWWYRQKFSPPTIWKMGGTLAQDWSPLSPVDWCGSATDQGAIRQTFESHEFMKTGKYPFPLWLFHTENPSIATLYPHLLAHWYKAYPYKESQNSTRTLSLQCPEGEEGDMKTINPDNI